VSTASLLLIVFFDKRLITKEIGDRHIPQSPLQQPSCNSKHRLDRIDSTDRPWQRS
jgi:hypothetical protein